MRATNSEGTDDQSFNIDAFATPGMMIHVDDDAPSDLGPNDPCLSDPDENGSTEHPFDSIQEAIDIAVGGVAVIVYEGAYHENLNLAGKNIMLSSADPNDPNVVADTIINGNRIGTVVTFAGGESPDCLLIGFTIKGGNAEFGGGIYCYNSSPTISKCVISGNWAERGGGICNYNGSPSVMNCLLSGNWAVLYGGGMYNLDSNSTPAVINCALSGNSSDHGGGIYNETGGLLLTSSILWGNDDNRGTDESAQIDVNNSVTLVNYSCVQGWTSTLGGIGNFDVDPCFAELGYWDDNATLMDASDDFWVNGDYHLRSQAGRWDPSSLRWVKDNVTSPCIDKGSPDSDWTGELWPHGRRTNVGAYGGTPEASMSLLSPISSSEQSHCWLRSSSTAWPIPATPSWLLYASPPNSTFTVER